MAETNSDLAATRGTSARQLSLKVVPCRYEIVECISWTVGADAVTMAVQGVATRHFTESDSTRDELMDDILGGCVWHGVRETADDRYADRDGIPVGGVGTHSIPAASLVGVAVLPHQEIVTDIGPSIAVHVVVLDRTNDGLA